MIDFLSRIIIPLLTFLAGAFIQSYRTQFTETVQQLNELIEEIEATRDAATKYWANAAGAAEATLAVEVRSGLHLISQLSSEFHLPNQADLDAGLDKFIEAATGGEFETAGRAADLGRALDMRLAAAELISLLRRRRRQINGWTFPIVEAGRSVGAWLAPYKLGQRVGRLVRLMKPKE